LVRAPDLSKTFSDQFTIEEIGQTSVIGAIVGAIIYLLW
jgi:hypothetical protein